MRAINATSISLGVVPGGLLVVGLLLLTLLVSPSQAQNTFYVDSWNDDNDLSAGDGVCESALGECTFRAAIDETNALPNSGGPDVISFANIPILWGRAVIEAGIYTAGYYITAPVVIDATTAAGEVVLDGNNLNGAFATRLLTLTGGSGGSTVKGLTIIRSWMAIRVRTNNNTIQQNYIGLLQDGSAYGNTSGIEVDGDRNLIGGVGDGQTYYDQGNGNVIGNSEYNGIIITGSENKIRRNFIGVDLSGQNIGNGEYGIHDYGLQNKLGGPVKRHGNRIGFNAGGGIQLTVPATGASDPNGIVRNNYIGTDNAGSDQGNLGPGISMTTGFYKTIGGTKSQGNVIGFNTVGIDIEYAVVSTISGNFIGVNRSGDDIGNDGDGISILLSVNNVIGYAHDATIPLDTPQANKIAANGGLGIAAEFLNGMVQSIRGNTIYDNAGLGIDLGVDGPTPNDDDDADIGPNALMNYPNIIRAFYRAGSDDIAIEFDVSSDDTIVSYPLTIDAYLADDAISGEGKTYIGTVSYTVPNVEERIEIPASSVIWSLNDVVVLTATDADGNTSEFSPASTPLDDASFSADNNEAFEIAHQAHPPTEVQLSGPYPNPFNPQTTLTLTLPESAPVRITVHDVLGRQVALLHNGVLPAGVQHTLTFDATGLASGTYLLRIASDQFVETRRMNLLK